MNTLSKALSGAIIEGDYRYLLWRYINEEASGTALFVMLNPSTADQNVDDATIRRCISFTRSWGLAQLEVVNLFGLRSTDPKALLISDDPVGPRNFEYIEHAVQNASKIVLAWGTHGTLHNRDKDFLREFNEYSDKFECLGKTMNGHPKHPLYIAAAQPLMKF